MAADGSIVIDTKLDNKGFDKGAQSFKQQVDGLKKAVDETGRKMGASTDSYVNAIKEAQSASKSAANNQKALTREIEKTEAALARTREKQDMQQRKWEASRESAIAKAMDEFNKNNAGADALPWEDESKAAEQLAEDMNAAVQRVMESFGSLEDNATFRNLAVEVEYLEQKLADLRAQLAEVQAQANTSGETAQPDVSEAANETQKAADSAESAWTQLGKVVTTAAGGFAKLAGAAARAGVSVARAAGGAALSYLRKLASAAKNAAIQFAKLAASAIRGGFKKLGGLIAAGTKSIFGFGKSTDNAQLSLSSLFRQILSVSAIMQLLKKGFAVAQQGMEEIGKKNPAVKAALDSLSKALSALKGSLATAFAPVLTAVAPALTTLINMLTAAINTIGAFMAALTGKGTYQASVGIADVGKSAKSSSGSVKDLERQLASFDKLDILKANSGGGGGGGGGGGSGLAYETKTIEGGLAEFANNLRDLFSAHQFEAIGGLIADGINGAFEKAKKMISWESLGAKITEIVHAITGIFNGLVDGINWTLIGETFGEGVNTVVNTWNALFDNTRFYNLGAGITDTLNSMIATVDGEKLGRAFTQKINAILSAATAFVTKFKWGDAGTTFGETVYSLLGSVDWDLMGIDIATAIDGVFEALEGAVGDFSWGQLAYDVAAGVNRIFDLNWEYVGSTLAKLFNTALEGIGNAIKGIQWNTHMVKLMVGINTFFYSVEWDALGRTIASLFGIALDGLYTAAVTFDWEKVLEGFSTGMNTFVEDFGDKLRGQDWASAGRKMTAGLVTMRESVNWDGIANILYISFNEALDFVGSAASVLAADAPNLARDLTNALNKVILKINWKDGPTSVSGIFSTLLNGALDFMKVFVLNFDETEFATNIKNAFASVKWGEIAEKAWELMKSAFLKLGNVITILFGDGPIIDTSKLDKSVRDVNSAIYEKLLTKNNVTGSTGEVFTQVATTILDAIKDALSKIPWADLGARIHDFFVYDIKWADIWSSLEAVLEQVLKGAADFFGSLIFGEEVWSKIRAFLTSNPEEDLEPSTPIEQQQAELALTLNLNDVYQGAMDALEDELAGVEINIADYIDFSGWDKLRSDVQVAWFEQISKVFGSDEAFTLMRNAGVDMTKILAKGISSGNISVEKAGKDFIIKFANGAEVAWDGEKEDLIRLLEDLGIEADVGVNFEPTTPTGRNYQNGGLLRYLQNIFAPGVDTENRVQLIKQGWTDLKTFVGTNSILTAIVELTKKIPGQTVGTLFGTVIAVLATLAKKYSSDSSGGLFGTLIGVLATLGKKNNGDSSGGLFGTLITVLASLGKKNKNDSSGNLFGTAFETFSTLKKAKGSADVQSLYGTTLGVTVTLTKKKNNSLKWTAVDAQGNRQVVEFKKSGGAYYNGFWHNIPKYARGTHNAHGTLFAAGEAGPEVVGHVGGRTEVLNKSQLAQTMQSAVTIGMLTALRSITFRVPNVATSAVPYEVAAQAAKSAADMQATLDANNEDLIQTIISVIGAQTTAIVAALQAMERNGASGNTLTAQQVINEINRRTQMFSASPLKGV